MGSLAPSEIMDLTELLIKCSITLGCKEVSLLNPIHTYVFVIIGTWRHPGHL